MTARRIREPHRCAQESDGIGGEADDGPREGVHLKVPHPKKRRDTRLLKVPRSHASRRRERLDRVAQPETVQNVHQTAGTKRCAEDHPMSSSGKRAHTIPLLVSRILLKSDVGVGPASVRRDAKRTSSMWEERADQTNMEACSDTASKVLGWRATVAGIRSETTQLQKCEMLMRRRMYEKSSTETVISTKTSHKAKRDEIQPRVVTNEHADAMLAPDHYASTPRTQALRSVISRMMSKCRTRQLESRGTLSAGRERVVRAETPKDLRVSGGWCWHLVRALWVLG